MNEEEEAAAHHRLNCFEQIRLINKGNSRSIQELIEDAKILHQFTTGGNSDNIVALRKA